jgi:hypothetical protein
VRRVLKCRLKLNQAKGTTAIGSDASITPTLPR